MARSKGRLATFFLTLLYLAGLACVGYLAWYGWSYYRLPLDQRPYAPLHGSLKPGGPLGHGLGILGSAMVLLLFLYSARKRELFALRMGSLRRWLDIHILMGVFGPLLITLHTSFKFNGIVSISYFSMLAVMFSGIFGRYIYMQIPRDPAGAALGLREISLEQERISQALEESYGLSSEFIAVTDRISGAHLARNRGALTALFAVFFLDLTTPFRMRRLRKQIEKKFAALPHDIRLDMLRTAKQKARLQRRSAFLDSMNHVFHLWHVIHKPFAIVMVIIMFVHIGVAILFGYRWIF